MKRVVDRIQAALPTSPFIALFFDGEISGELFAGLGINFESFAAAPNAECTRVYINASDSLSALFKRCFSLLSVTNEVSPCRGQIIGVFEDREEGTIIFLPNPKDSDSN